MNVQLYLERGNNVTKLITKLIFCFTNIQVENLEAKFLGAKVSLNNIVSINQYILPRKFTAKLLVDFM